MSSLPVPLSPTTSTGTSLAGHAVDQAQQVAHRLAPAGDLVVAEAGLARRRARARAACASRRARRRARAAAPRRGRAARSARRAARRRSTASRASAMAMAACEATTRTHASSRGPNAPLRTAVVEVDDAERLAARHERHGEDAAQPERVDARVRVAERRERVGRDHGVARLDRAPRDGLRERELLAREVVAREVARGARDEPAVGRAQEQEPALDARPEDQRVEDLREQGPQADRAPRATRTMRLELRRTWAGANATSVAPTGGRPRPGDAPRATREARPAFRRGACAPRPPAPARSDAPHRRRRCRSRGEPPRRASGRATRAARARRRARGERRAPPRSLSWRRPARMARGPRPPPLPARGHGGLRRVGIALRHARAIVDGLGRPDQPPRRRAELVFGRRRPAVARSASMAHARAARRPGRAPRPAPIARRRPPARRATRAPRARASAAASSVACTAPSVASAAARASQARAARSGRPRRSHRSAARVALASARAMSPASVAAAASLVRYVASSTTAPARVASSTARPNAVSAAPWPPRRHLEETPDRLEPRLRLGVDRLDEGALDDAQPRVVRPAPQGHERTDGRRRRPLGAFEEPLGALEIEGVPRQSREGRPGAPGPLGRLGPLTGLAREGARRSPAGAVVVATTAGDLRAHRVDLGPLDAHERHPGAARLPRPRQRSPELDGKRRRREPAGHVVLGERQRLGARHRARELADEARRAFGPVGDAPLGARAPSPRPSTSSSVHEAGSRRRARSTARATRARSPVSSTPSGQAAALGPTSETSHRERRTAPRGSMATGPSRHRGARSRRRERARRGGRFLDPGARRLADLGRDRRGRALDVPHALREVGPPDAVDARLPRLAIVGAELEATRRSPGDPGGARSSARSGREERLDPSRRLPRQREVPGSGFASWVRRRQGGGVEDLGEEHAERPHVRGRSGFSTLAQLGGRVARRSAEGPRGQLPGEPQVDQRRAAIVGGVARRRRRRAEHVRGLDVAMVNSGLVELLEGPRHRMGHDGREVLAVRARPDQTGQPAVEGHPVDPFGHEKVRAHIEERRPPPAPHPGQELGLAKQRRRGALRALLHPLEGRALSALRVPGEPDDGRRPLPHALHEPPVADARRQLLCRGRVRAHTLEGNRDQGHPSTPVTGRGLRAAARPIEARKTRAGHVRGHVRRPRDLSPKVPGAHWAETFHHRRLGRDWGAAFLLRPLIDRRSFDLLTIHLGAVAMESGHQASGDILQVIPRRSPSGGPPPDGGGTGSLRISLPPARRKRLTRIVFGAVGACGLILVAAGIVHVLRPGQDTAAFAATATAATPADARRHAGAAAGAARPRSPPPLPRPTYRRRAPFGSSARRRRARCGSTVRRSRRPRRRWRAASTSSRSGAARPTRSTSRAAATSDLEVAVATRPVAMRAGRDDAGQSRD